MIQCKIITKPQKHIVKRNQYKFVLIIDLNLNFDLISFILNENVFVVFDIWEFIYKPHFCKKVKTHFRGVEK